MKATSFSYRLGVVHAFCESAERYSGLQWSKNPPLPIADATADVGVAPEVVPLGVDTVGVDAGSPPEIDASDVETDVATDVERECPPPSWPPDPPGDPLPL